MLDEWYALCDRIASMGRAAVSFSGGIDSTVVLAAAVNVLPGDHIGVFADVPMLSERQRLAAAEIAGELGANFVVLELGWDDVPGVRDNTAKRCYLCKKGMYSAVKRKAQEDWYNVCLDGENASDMSYDRPGRRAAEEFGIISPLRDLGFERDTVRRMFADLRLKTDVQKETCMATRIRQDVPFDESDIRRIEECENIIRYVSGVRQIRMRVADGSADLFTSPDEICLLTEKKEELTSRLMEKGISAVRIDKNGYNE